MSTVPTIVVVRQILKAKWIIIAISLVAGVGAYLYSLTLPNYYKSTINCVPATDDQNALGSSIGALGSALKDIGLSKISQGSGSSYEFMVVLTSRQIADSMIRRFDLVNEYNMAGDPFEWVREEFATNLEVELHAEGNYEIAIWSVSPSKSVEMCKSFVGYANAVANSIHQKNAAKSTVYLTSRVNAIDSILDVLTDSLGKYSNKYLMFDPESQATASAKALTDAKTQLLQQQTLVGLLEQSYGTQDPQVRAQTQVLKQMQEQMQGLTNAPGFVGDFSIRDAAGIGAGYIRLMTEFQAHAKLKAFILPTLEQARLDQQKSTPSLIVVDDPVAMEKKDRPRRTLIGAGAAIGTGILCVVFMLLWRAWRSFISQTISS